MPKYTVGYYETDSGRSPVTDFLDKLERKQPRAVAKCYSYVDKLEEHGPFLIKMHQYAEKVEDKIYCLRPEWQGTEYRLAYTWSDSDQAFILFDAFVKKTQELTEHDKRRLRKRMREVLDG